MSNNEALQKLHDQLVESDLSSYVKMPMICVLGGTSSGKSSLLSNLSGIELPSSHKLTTRCPLMITMKKGPHLMARIRVHWKHDVDKRPVFAEQLIAEDQWSTISSSLMDTQNFILDQTGISTKAEIAKDLIVLSIQSPDCVPLTMLDLPGLVCTKAKDEDESMIQEIQALLDDYLGDSRFILLVVVPANVDYHNAIAIAEAMKRDPHGIRTIPVITKPDLVDLGAESQVADLLLGRNLTFRQGFHMIKGRGQAALDEGQSIQQGLQDEDNYFKTTEPWKSFSQQNRLGTIKLRDKLSMILVQHTQQQIPYILQELQEQLDRVHSEIKRMGQHHLSESDRRRYYQDICMNIVAELGASLTGKRQLSSKSVSAAAMLHKATAVFVDQISLSSLSTVGQIVEGSPVLVRHNRGTVRGEVVHFDQRFACIDFIDEMDSDSDILFETTGLISSQEVIEKDTVWSDGSKICIARQNQRYDVLRQIPISMIQSDPSWLKAKIQENKTDDLPCFLNSHTFRAIIADFIDEDLTPHCTELVKSTQRIVSETVHDTLLATTIKNRFPALHSQIIHQCQRVVDDLMKSFTDEVTSHLATEKHPFTAQVDEMTKEIMEARQSRIKRELEIAFHVDQERVFNTQAVKATLDDVFRRSSEGSMDEYIAQEMELLLKAYGRRATKRVQDRMPMLCWKMFRSLSTSILDSLLSVQDQTLEHCMKETPEYQSMYFQKLAETKHLQQAIETFKSIL